MNPAAVTILSATSGLNPSVPKPAPPAEPISVQRWGRRRIGLAFGAFVAAMWVLGFVIDNLTGAGFV